jgi:hypothetical protein
MKIIKISLFPFIWLSVGQCYPDAQAGFNTIVFETTKECAAILMPTIM